MIIEETDYLTHIGTPRHSGRYPWGSGGDIENQRNPTLNDQVKDLKKQGLTESEIAQGFGMTINELRARKSIETNERRQANINMAQRLRDKGNSPTAIATRMEVPERTVRSWLVPGAADKADKLTATVNKLREEVATKPYLDVGRGTSNWIGVSDTRLSTALAVLKDEGYTVHNVPGPQVTTGHNTNRKVLSPPGTTRKDVFNNLDNIETVSAGSEDGGKTFGLLREPIKLNSKRIEVVYSEQGGDKADGMIYIRPKMDDISIGGAKYAQVRVAVGNDHYLKGMAMYKDDLPDGVDVQFHTSKSSTGNKLDAMKKNVDEKSYSPNGPHVLLKSVKRQILADAGTDKERVTSAMNIVDEEGAWDSWSKNMSSQMLSKQRPALAKAQTNMTFERRKNDLEEISRLTNATVKKKLLDDFADSADSAAVHLKAAALPRTANRVILPLANIKPTEIYAPQFNHGERVALIRHPHGGPFEIPELIVNNNNREGKRLLGQARDAVGIHHEVAKHLSGADFDGDTVLVIPNDRQRVKNQKPLDGLKDFDPRRAYPGFEGSKKMTNTQREMGEISNLIADMSLREAPHHELAQAIRHSMVVIDAEKHGLDYKASYNDNGIAALKKKYQTGGASTLISRAKSPLRIDEVKPRTRPKGGPINLETGELEFELTNRRLPSGALAKTKTRKLANTRDARTLMSTPIGTPMERIYADHSNKLKALANTARLTSEKTPAPKQSSSARKVYKTEVDSLKSKLDLAQRNAPLERRANSIASAMVKARKEDNPSMDEETIRKITNQSLIQARIRTGAQKLDIKFSPSEWDAIQAGAVSHAVLVQLLQHSDMDHVRTLATPKTPLKMTSTKTIRARQMIADGYPLEDIAKDLGVSVSTLERAVG
jgi:DNA-binding CsgD family transcriptional regulator